MQFFVINDNSAVVNRFWYQQDRHWIDHSFFVIFDCVVKKKKEGKLEITSGNDRKKKNGASDAYLQAGPEKV